MGRRVSTLQDVNVGISRDVDSKYDDVKIVADNIDTIQIVANSVGNSLKYLGASVSIPTTRLDGNPIQDGDYYFDTTNGSEHITYYDLADNLWFAIDPNAVLDNAAAAEASAAAALVSEGIASAAATQAALDRIQTTSDAASTAADLVQTNIDQIQTSADVVSTNSDKISTAADAVSTGLDAASASADAIQTAADRVQTGLDSTATSADAVQTSLDKADTGADKIQTALDAAATSSDATQTNLDKIATAADRVQTGLDKVATNSDATQTGLDRVQTGLDRIQTTADAIGTAADKVATNADVLTTNADAVSTSNDAATATTKAAEALASANAAAISEANTANKVDKTTTVNGKALSSDVVLTPYDIGLGGVESHTVSGVMIAGGKENQLRDSGSFTMPLANSVNANTVCTVTLPDTYSNSRPTLTTSGSDVFRNSNGTDTVINILGSVTITLTSNGTSEWDIDVVSGSKGADGINMPTEIVSVLPVSPAAGTLYIVIP